MRKMMFWLFIISLGIFGAFIGIKNGASVTIFMGIAGCVLGYFIGKFYLILTTPGKTDINTMTEDEKKTYDYEQENLQGFSGGFFGQAAISITNLIAYFTKKPGYQQHPELFAMVYGIITFGFGFFRDSVVQDLLNGVGNVDIKKSKEICDVDDD